VKIDDSAIEELLAPTVPLYEQNSQATQVRFETAADAGAIADVLRTVQAHQDSMRTSAETRSVMALLTRALLPNLLQLSGNGQPIEIGQSASDGCIRLAVRCPALATSHRLGRDASTEEAQRLAAAELANVLNLGWFGLLAINSDGSAMLFERSA
jgi:hypothetical protein